MGVKRVRVERERERKGSRVLREKKETEREESVKRVRVERERERKGSGVLRGKRKREKRV